MDENRTPNQENQQPQNQGQPQYQQPQPQYQPPQYYAPQPKPANRGKGGGWIGFLRVMAWILFAVEELAFVITGIAMMAGARVANSYFGYSYTNWGAIFGGLGIIAGGTLMAFIMIAGINVALDMAMNTARTATNTAKLVEKLEEIEKKVK